VIERGTQRSGHERCNFEREIPSMTQRRKEVEEKKKEEFGHGGETNENQQGKFYFFSFWVFDFGDKFG